MYRTDTFTPSSFTSEGNICLRGKNIPYNTVSEDNVIYDNDGKAIASIFSYSYFRSDAENLEKRPVLFCFNGGPGSSSMMVHSGFLGTYRVKYPENPDEENALPPYEIIENPQCMLDAADIVVIDPMGTGYGALLDEEHKKDFFGIEQDAEALLYFIEKWLSKYNRWQSPKYIVGESYGCTRAATAVGLAQGYGEERSYSVSFDGVILIGNTVSVGDYFNENVPVEPSVLGFPTFAAVNWYHHHPSAQTIEEFVKEAKAFADSEYLLALYKGDAISEDEKEAVIKKVIYYTGVSREYLLKNDLRIDEITVRTQFLRDEERQVSRYDGRITRPFYKPYVREEGKWRSDDATDGKYGPIFHSAVCGTIFPKLNIHMDRTFVPARILWDNWDNKAKHGNTGELLSSAMLKTPGMRTFFANGWYDICTQIGIAYYTIDHAGLPKDRTFIKGYESGHMIYLGEDNVKELTDDILKFISGQDPTK